jgi:hypothetical protein
VIPVGTVLSSGWAAGLNLYAVVALLGISGRLGWADACAVTPEPFRNLMPSLGDSGTVGSLMARTFAHPKLAGALAVVAAACCLIVIVVLFRFVRLLFRGFGRLAHRQAPA